MLRHWQSLLQKPDILTCFSFFQVFVGGQCIGGNDDTQAAHASGKLAEMLQAAGVV